MNYIERYWRDATPADAIKEPPMVARFRNSEEHVWVIGPLMGIRRDNFYQWYSTNLGSHKECQVYDAPDPGEGWRLIDTASEKWQEGDEFQHNDGMWDRSVNGRSSGFSEGFFYRRRITPAVTYVPFTWGDRDKLRGRWIVDRTGEQEYTIDDFLNDSGILYICGHPAEYFLNWTFLDTGEPVGKKVAQ